MASRSRTVAFIECKTYGHAWDEYNPPVDGFDFTESFDRLTLRCVRCSTTRHDYLDRNGDVEHRHYSYPDEYKYATGDKPSRAVLRLLLHGHTIPRGVE